MLVSLFRKSSRILRNQLRYQQHICFFILILINQQQQGSDGRPTKWNRSIQRRFMWKQMDSTVDGFVDRVVTGARVMKTMIDEFMPAKQYSSNAMDYLPTETTRIKYIIRNPHTKETEVIRVRPSKKVVKLMVMTPNPLTHKPKQIYTNDVEHTKYKFKSMNLNESDYTTADKFKSMFMLNPDKLRQLEKEQELVAERRIPIRSKTKPIYMTFGAEKPKYFDNDVVTGQIREMHQSWKPIYRLGDIPSGFSTSKPYIMSALHTSVVGELLPEPQKQVNEPLTSNIFLKEHPKKTHTYEVTEFAAEESVIQPYAHDYYKSQSPPGLLFTQMEESVFKHFPVTTEIPYVITQIGNDSVFDTYHTEYPSQREFLHSKGSYSLNEKPSTTTSLPSTISNTEKPKYPAEFLKQIRNRTDSKYSKIFPEKNSWIPSNATYTNYRITKVPFQQHLTTVDLPQRIKSQRWSPDAEDTYLTHSEPLSTYTSIVSTNAEVPAMQEFKTVATLIKSSSRENVHLKSSRYSPYTEAKHRNARHRGSVKYGDKLEIEAR